MMEDKTDRFLDAIENSGKYSDEEMEAMFADPTNRELYSTISKTADALAETSEPDTDREWEEFKSRRLLPQSNVLHLFASFIRRNAAAVLICVVAALGVVAASIGVTYSYKYKRVESSPVEPTEKATVQQSLIVNDTIVTDDIPVAPQTIVFKNAALEDILSEIAAYYGATVIYKSTGVKTLNLYFNWDQGQSLSDIINQLDNFDRINIRLDGNVITVE